MKHKKKYNEIPKTYISLFSGAGVGCYGFNRQKFSCIATAENNARRLKIQKYNRKCIYDSGYICSDIGEKEVKQKIYDEVSYWHSKHKISNVDVIVATPPCQGMSLANHKKKDEEKRNSLVLDAIEIIETVKPKIFVIENVRMFLGSMCTDGKEQPQKIGDVIDARLGGLYNIHAQVINFKDYGNPSSRTRCLVLGVNKDLSDVTPLDFFPTNRETTTVREAIGDLPKLKQMGSVDDNDIYHNFRTYAKHMESWIELLKEDQSAFDNKEARRKPHRIIDGKRVLNQQKNGDKYKRSSWDKIAPCIHTRNDILSSQTTIHPADNRVFSVRELMRLMSIPDSFKWSDIAFSHLNEMSQAEKLLLLKKEEINIRQCIGEAVPTCIFEQIAQKVINCSNHPPLNITQIKKIKSEHGLSDHKRLKGFIKNNLSKFSFANLCKIAELSNLKKAQNAAYYTRQDIVYAMVKNLPEASKYKNIRILEPSVGMGSFLPLLIQKYKSITSVIIDVIDIDLDSLDILKVLLKKIDVPSNVEIRFVHDDFLTRSHPDKDNLYDIVIGNPPFGKVKNQGVLQRYRENAHKTICSTNLVTFFIEKAISCGKLIAFITPKSLLSTPEFQSARDSISGLSIRSIVDYGEKAFQGVKIETISIVAGKYKSNTPCAKIESYIRGMVFFKDQNYICGNEFPNWLIYRNNDFDKVASKLDLGVFKAVRDRQITKKHTKPTGKIRVLKSRNIGSNQINDISNYDTYVEAVNGFSVAKHMNSFAILVPNLSYNPRACLLPKNTIVDGSVALLFPKQRTAISEEDLGYYSSREFKEFYQIARNYGSRSLNIDSNSVYFFGINRI